MVNSEQLSYKPGVEHEQDQKILCVATGSHMRIEAARLLFPGYTIVSIPGGEEAHDQTPAQIASGKVTHVRTMASPPSWEGLTQQPRPHTFGILGADTMTLIPIRQVDGSIVHTPQGKPKSIGEVLEIFQQWFQGIVFDRRKPGYSVRMATCWQNEGDPIIEEQSIRIELFRESLSQLATPAGMEEYLRVFRKVEAPWTPLHTSAGLSIATLFNLHAIDAIDGTASTDLQFPDAVLHACFMAAIGYHPRVISRIDPSASERIHQWNPYKGNGWS